MGFLKAIVNFAKKLLGANGYAWLIKKFHLLLRFGTCKVIYPAVYKRAARKPLNEKKVVFIETTEMALSDNYKLLWEKLNDYDYEKHVAFLDKTHGGQIDLHRRYKAVIAACGDAKYILLNDAFVGFGHVKFRKGTKVINVWHACGAFKKFGFGTADLNFGETREVQEKYPNYTFLDEMYVSSPEVIDKYAYSTGLPEEKVIPLGVGRTDMFYDEKFIESAREKFRFYFPKSAGKKVILYAPTFRGRVKKAKAPNVLNIGKMHKELGDEYVLVTKHHPFVKQPPKISRADQDFAVDFTQVMTIEELLCVADICISDYSSLVFEYSLFEKPIIFFAYDRAEYDDWRGFYYDYDEMTPGPILKKTKEVIDYIKNVDERFDAEEVIAFREKFMSSCDGHVTEKIMTRVFDDLESHRLPEKEKKKEKKQPNLVKAAKAKKFNTRPVKEIRAVIEKELPLTKGKTLVAYVTDDDPTPCYPQRSNFFTWSNFYENAPDDMAVLLFHNGRPKNAPFSCELYFRCPDDITEEELLTAADIIITNRNKNALHFVGEKPVYFCIPKYKFSCQSKQQYDEKTKAAKELHIFARHANQLSRRMALPYSTDSEALERAVNTLLS